MGRPKNLVRKSRLNLAFTTEERKKLEAVAKTGNMTSLTSAITKAVHVLGILQALQKRGGKVVMIEPNGESAQLLIL